VCIGFGVSEVNFCHKNVGLIYLNERRDAADRTAPHCACPHVFSQRCIAAEPVARLQSYSL